MNTYKVDLYFDGACKGNPGESSYGFVIKYIIDENENKENKENEEEKEITDCKYIGLHTNNEAEYIGLLECLKRLYLLDLNINVLNIFGDSKLVIEQVSGNWKTNVDNLRKLRNDVQDILKQLKDKNNNIKINIKHIRREFNQKADKLANQAIEKQ